MTKGDIVLIPFPFTDLTGIKTMPALVLSSGETDIILAFITTRLKWEESIDLAVKHTETNGLKRDSLVRLGKLATLDKNLALGKIGTLSQSDLQEVDKKLTVIFKLSESQNTFSPS
jgi:mRNA interferase MazF